MTLLDVLVTCHPHAPEPSFFPQVRGHYLAKHLARSGLRAEFRALPAVGVECRVLICSEYQCEMEWFDRFLAAPLAGIPAERLFCLTEYSLGDREHFSTEYCNWFGARGGVLYQLKEARPNPREHWIGLGVDLEALEPEAERPRDTVIFDFAALVKEPNSSFDPTVIELVRHRFPACRLVGTGPSDTPLRRHFDGWVPYGQSHRTYVRTLFPGAFAFVVGLVRFRESLGLAVAEAQVAGACVVLAEGSVKEPVLCPEARVVYDPERPDALADAIAEARQRNPATIRAQAAERFDYAAVARRTRAAIGL